MSLPRSRQGWIFGVDTSAAQGRLDVPALVNEGASFAFHKATEGLHDIDPQWTTSARASLATGLPFGPYGVLSSYGPKFAAAQARHFVEVAKDSGATLPPGLDFELARGLTASAAILAARIWLDEVENALGLRCMVYTGPAFIEDLARLATQDVAADLAAIATRPLWLAHYTGSVDRPPRVPRWWDNWTLWQESGGRAESRDASTLPNSSTYVDVDWFRGEVTDLEALAVKAPQVAQVAQVATTCECGRPRHPLGRFCESCADKAWGE